MEVKLFAQNFNPFGFLPAKIRFFSQTAYGLPSFLHFYLRQDTEKATIRRFFSTELSHIEESERS
jgi:hypothetical protein